MDLLTFERDKLEAVVKQIVPDCALLDIVSLKGGISNHMVRLEIARLDGSREELVVRCATKKSLEENPHIAAYEYHVLSALYGHGLKVQVPRYLDQSMELLGQPYLVVDYINGKPEYEPATLDGFILKLTEYLVEIHKVNSAVCDLQFLTDQKHRLTKKFAKPPVKIDYSLREDRIRDVVGRSWPFEGSNEPVLLHGDYWPGNILWRDGEIVAVIDWEDAELGDPLYEIAITRLDILWVYGTKAMLRFTDIYRSLSSIDFANLAYFDLLAALRPCSNIAEWARAWVDLGRDDITESTMREGHQFFVDQAFDALGH